MRKIVILIALVLISSCSYFSLGPLQKLTTSAKDTCVKLAPESGFNVENVCVGDSTYIMKTKADGKIVEIDTSRMSEHKAETILFVVEDKNKQKIKITGKDVVLNKKGLCVKSIEKKSLCVGEKFKDLSDGDSRFILGFSMSTVKEPYINVFTVRTLDGLIHNGSLWEAMSSVKANKTGMIEDISSCKIDSLIKSDEVVTKCAKKELIKKMDKTCDKFRHGNGRVLADIETKTIKTTCTKKYSMFGAPSKTCTAELVAKCEKTREFYL